MTQHRYRQGAGQYWIYEPADPTPTTASLVIFMHGWGATNPAVYGAWIDHIVRRGSIVIYPRYQEDNRTPLADFLPNTLGALQDALARLWREPGHVRADLTRVAVVGHSVGGLLAANVAAGAAGARLPAMRAVMAIQPGRTWNPLPRLNVALDDMSKIPAGTLLLAVVGDDDPLARDVDAKRIFNETTNIAPADKNYITLRSDDHGRPELKATHFAPAAPDLAYSNGEMPGMGRGARGGGAAAGAATSAAMPASSAEGAIRQAIRGRVEQRIEQRMGQRAGDSGSAEQSQPDIMADPSLLGATGDAAIAGGRPGPRPGPRPGIDALDYNGLWKLFDALTDAAFYNNKNRDSALGNTTQQRDMGKWSDGVAVKELVVVEKP